MRNDLVDRIAEDESFGFSKDEILEILNPDNLCGRASHQVEDYVRDVIDPIIEQNADLIENIDVEINV